MEFWGVEVKPGQFLKVALEEGQLLHISQAALGDVKGKVKGFIPLRVKIEGREFVFGSLSADTIPQVHFDLVFHTEFELSHGCKNGSVYFCGNLEDVLPEEHDDFPYDSEVESQDSEDELLVNDDVTNGKAKTLNSAQPEKKKSDDIDVSDEVDSEDESEDEETPKEINIGNKRGVEIPSKVLAVPSKKTKAGTRLKGGDDNCGCGHAHVAATKRTKPSGKKKAKNGGK